jgi:hypothetical protein
VDVQHVQLAADEPAVAWFSQGRSANARAASAHLDALGAAASATHAAAIQAALAVHNPGPITFAEAVGIVCGATCWPVGHVWVRGADGWQSSGAWHGSTEFAELQLTTAATDLGSGRGIVAAVLHLEACRFLPGLEGLGSATRKAQAAALGLTAVVGVPVRRAGKVEAVLEFITAGEVEPEGRLAEALLAVADRTRRAFLPARIISPPAARRLVELPVELAG